MANLYITFYSLWYVWRSDATFRSELSPFTVGFPTGLRLTGFVGCKSFDARSHLSYSVHNTVLFWTDTKRWQDLRL